LLQLKAIPMTIRTNIRNDSETMKVFLSSTYEDLREHRAKAAQAIERLGQQGVRMEVFGARPVDATEVSLDEIDASDAFLGIYAHTYGYVPAGSSISITEREFDFAQEHSKPTFCFVVDEEFPWSPKFIEPEPGQSKLKLFKRRVSTTFVRDHFTTPDDLAYKVASSLGRFLISPIWIAELADTIVGTVATVPKGTELYIRSMAVRPGARGSGIGARLLNTVEAFAAAHRYRRLLLNTSPFLLAAVELYERHGFRYTGEQPDLFGTQLLTMAKDIRTG
jgi:ribosomal protein S18 acetylase RimI-like enzyme